jgi:hypothetical protein
LLGLQKNEIGVENILSTLCAPGDPLPCLRELWMETEEWPRHLPAMMRFSQSRNHLKRLKIWSIIPKLDYGTLFHTSKEFLTSLTNPLLQWMRMSALNLSNWLPGARSISKERDLTI